MRRCYKHFTPSGVTAKLVRTLGDRRGEGAASFNMSLAFDQLGERERAVPLAEAALQIYKQLKTSTRSKCGASWRSGGEVAQGLMIALRLLYRYFEYAKTNKRSLGYEPLQTT